jgi:energy-coupling factor transporter ATP-binding protein EcfA2
MLQQLEIGFLKSFREPQLLQFALPSGEPGSGYNLLVGKNNSGKSTVAKLLRDYLSSVQTLTIGQEARYDCNQPLFRLKWLENSEPQATEIEMHLVRIGNGGGYFTRNIDQNPYSSRVRYVPSRRPFSSEFQSTQTIDTNSYEMHDYINRRNSHHYFDSMLAGSVAALMRDGEKYRSMLEFLKSVDDRIAAIEPDHYGGRDILLFRSASGRAHPITDTGDGMINLVRIAYTLTTCAEKSLVIIDEPELSLHPQLQRNLYSALRAASAYHQLFVLTHSPHLVSWSDICRHGRLARARLNSAGYSELKSAAHSTLARLRALAVDDITSRKFYDAVCKELFFSDEAVLVEGSDDVHYISNYLAEGQQEELPFVGYGCGGASKIIHWMDLCLELGIVTAAIFDADKRSCFDECLMRFRDASDDMASFLLSAVDIRDKYLRDGRGRETTVDKVGVFERNGKIRKEQKLIFDQLMASIRTHLSDGGRVLTR